MSGVSDVAIMVPIERWDLSSDEQISLRHLKHYLGRYDKFLVVPEGLEIADPDFDLIRFPAANFESHAAYNHLLLSEELYGAFSRYAYLLTYQLDCLVFSDQLGEWCERDYDYIGAPWLKTGRLGWSYEGLERAGNGGFSLRRVDRCLEAIRRSNRTGLREVAGALADVRPSHLRRDLKRAVLLKRNAAATYPYNEDLWWANHARDYMPDFQVAPVERALEFAFETDPETCFERNGRRLPFGCHAWARYQRAFWTPHLLD